MWAILSLFVDGKTKTAPISYHEQRENNEYKARIHFENLEFLYEKYSIERVLVSHKEEIEEEEKGIKEESFYD